MTAEPENHELLSAYLDGELSADEHRRVQEWLRHNEDAREELRELEHLHSLLSGLPKESLPTSLHASVWEQCESVDAERATPATRGLSRATITRIALGVTAALGLIVGLKTLLPSFAPESMDEIAAASAPDPLYPEDRRASHDDLIEARLNSQVDRTRQQAVRAKVAPGERFRDKFLKSAGDVPKNPPRAVPKVEPAEETPRDPAVSRMAKAPAKQAVAGAGSKSLQFEADLKKVPVGQVVEALDLSGGKVAVVRLTVVDRRQGIRALKVLLKRHEIQPDSENTEANDSDLLAVSVEAPSDRLASALLDIQRGSDFGQMQLASALPTNALNHIEAKRNAKKLDKTDGSKPDEESDGKPLLTRKRAEKSPQREASDDVPQVASNASPPNDSSEAKKSPRNPSGEDSKELAKISRQLDIVLPPSFLADGKAQSIARGRRQPETDEAIKKRDAESTSMRLVFVFVEQAKKESSDERG